MHENPLLASDRADDISRDDLLKLFAGAGGDEEIVQKLMSPGAHLLQGSRGTGKTMLLRVAHERLRRSKKNILPVFVKFSSYLATYNVTARKNATYSPFQNWVLAKIFAALLESVSENRPGVNVDDRAFGPIPLQRYAQRLETHYRDDSVADPEKNASALGVDLQDITDFCRLDQLIPRIRKVLDTYGFQAVAFFFDEAAQSFAEELQPEFFQIMKHLRDERIFVKAAVYPHVTAYGKDFDVGHDAIVIPIDRRIEESDGMEFFYDFIDKRFRGTEVWDVLTKQSTLRDFLIKASGGNPRWFIHLLNIALSTDGRLTTPDVLTAVKSFPDSTLWPYLQNLRQRLRFKRKYVDAALTIAQMLVEDLREVNLKRDSKEKPVVYVAISNHKTVPYRVHAAIGILVNSGLLAHRGPKKITARETAELYLVHPAILIRENALFGQESNPSIEAWVKAFTDPSREKFKEYTRNNPQILEFQRVEAEDEGLICDYCGSPLPADAAFCHRCGRPVAQTSPYEELRKQPSSALELTPGIKQRLLQDGRFPTVGDILDATDEELDQIPYIGETRLRIIRYAAEEFVAG